MSDGLHLIVKGRVQGVCYRANTQKQAQRLGLSGWVRNLPNGDVEVVACGDAAALQQLVAWCRQGPTLAKVSDVMVQAYGAGEVFEDFRVR